MLRVSGVSTFSTFSCSLSCPDHAAQVRQLELEARASYGDVAATRLDEIRRIKLELKKASNRSKVMQMELERTELLGSGRAETNVGSHYSQLQENDKLLQKGYEYLQTSCAMAQETEMIGAGAAEELYQQRNAIYNVQSDVKKTRISIKEADEYLTKLLKQGRLNTFVMRVVFAGIGLAVLIIAVSRTLRMFL
ncbi:vesicle transport protein [Babesia caballi]|uniref:Vesicle transport protein n=1 Tax=Babesia caballi TaxID=5871 RepID=A0AAV4M0D7_BABCB|nr:vesicle transport protein [Babesia caballi]